MAITFDKKFEINAPIEAAWAFLTDPKQVAQCLPGAELTKQIDATTYEGTVSAKVGPIMAKYKGEVRLEKLDRATYEVVAVGRGQDVTGKGGADGKMVSRFRAIDPRKTEISISSEVNLTGKLVQFGRGLIQDVADQIFHKFTAAVRERLEKPAEAAAAVSPPSPRRRSTPSPC
ncbi:MAG: SRPBCC family protein [Candidatus Manganitrophus sp.]|nr:MAG: SRPBCC family protein [Candidatus Manganitrophus sp.]